jgi:hypothetical protein
MRKMMKKRRIVTTPWASLGMMGKIGIQYPQRHNVPWLISPAGTMLLNRSALEPKPGVGR